MWWLFSLVKTRNTKHFPLEAFVVTPREILTILEGKEQPQ